MEEIEKLKKENAEDTEGIFENAEDAEKTEDTGDLLANTETRRHRENLDDNKNSINNYLIINHLQRVETRPWPRLCDAKTTTIIFTTTCS